MCMMATQSTCGTCAVQICAIAVVQSEKHKHFPEKQVHFYEHASGQTAMDVDTPTESLQEALANLDSLLCSRLCRCIPAGRE